MFFMAECITLAHFGAATRQYHIYRIRGSTISHQTHYHDYYQVCFVISGELLHRQGDEEVLLLPGDAFVIPPGFSHSLQFTGKTAEIYSLSFAPTVFNTGFRRSNAWRFLSGLQPKPSATVRLRIVPDKDTCKSTLSLMECLLRQQQTEQATQLSAAPGIISAIVCLLAQSYYQQPQNAHQLGQLTDYNYTLLQCTQYIDTHYKENISLTDLAKQFGLSRAAFCAVFPQFTGLSPHKYIAQKRIQEAQMLIRAHPARPLQQIAMEVGYDDPSTFYRNFLRFAGMPPAKYRQMYVRPK